ncbi:hypothetical protein I316_00370 [Kwoniella heveanensis BCC8398]|uniref:Uncharacterized protein n=1 Tax=Kwoniella heveanensis BCC8398 TaxID=1296120 RepID=A0A1B9H4F0_9TREE|nr:hypothetical protein I316_00370 [Kwoniella heveanensis BCC8398]
MASPTLASSSRTILPRLAITSIGSTRGVLHRARPARIPKLLSPHAPKEPLPTSGTSHPVDPKKHGAPTPLTSAVSLEDSGLTFHHSPPPTMPSYTNGAVPTLLRWIGGENVALTGEEGAPVSRKNKERKSYTGELEWTEDVVQRMQQLRAEGKSRSEIGKSLNLPADQYRLIARVAPQTAVQAASKLTELEEQKSTWGYRKKLSRAVRSKRKEFW